MIAGYHLIWTIYGWWLPNDPRGSMSREIRTATIAGLGEIHYGRRRIQPAGRVMREFHDAARGVLQHPLQGLSPTEIDAAGRAFADVIHARNYTCYGCAVLPDHVHILIRKHRDQAETMIAALQDASRSEVLRCRSREADHPVWGGQGWKVYLETRDDMQRIVRYIQKNLSDSRWSGQSWSFVKQYDGWLPGQVRVVRRVNKDK